MIGGEDRSFQFTGGSYLDESDSEVWVLGSCRQSRKINVLACETLRKPHRISSVFENSGVEAETEEV